MAMLVMVWGMSATLMSTLTALARSSPAWGRSSVGFRFSVVFLFCDFRNAEELLVVVGLRR